MRRSALVALAALAAALLACGGAPPPPPAPPEPPPSNTAAPGPSRVITDTHIEALDVIRFVGSGARIADESGPTLDALASTLKGNPGLLLVEIDAYAPLQTVAQARAAAVVAALIARGVAPGRLAAGGVVDTSGHPRAPAVLIVKRAP